ncbi:MAG TPA: 30S ribosomal protein S20 [Bacillota bacterium]|nr:30S ribosomal protein S20 [Bacillota bacterium]
MPNIKSAKKRVEVSAQRNEINVSRRSALRTSLKKVNTSIAKEPATAQANLINAIKTLDAAAGQGIIHKNQAARRKSRLAKKVNALAK